VFSADTVQLSAPLANALATLLYWPKVGPTFREEEGWECGNNMKDEELLQEICWVWDMKYWQWR
jgi:hypothetical protein